MIPTSSDLLADTPLFRALSVEERQRIQAEATQRRFAAGELILREGEHGQTMFVVAEGAVQVFSRGQGGQEVVLARLERGDAFGEQAIVSEASQRTASARAFEDVVLLELSRAHLLAAIASDGELAARLRQDGETQRQHRREALQAALFQSFDLEPASLDAEVVRFERFAAGEVIFRQGDPGARVYAISTGRAGVSVVEDGAERPIAELGVGQFFGERTLLEGTPRNATVTALEDLEVTSFDGAYSVSLHQRNGALRALMESLRSVYALPRRGVMVIQSGRLEGEPCLTTTWRLPDGRSVVATRSVGRSTFVAVVAGAHPTDTVPFERNPAGQRRAVLVEGDHLVGVTSDGDWTGLGPTLEWILDGRTVEAFQLALFRDLGELERRDPSPSSDDREIVCGCVQVTRGALLRCIASGCHTRDAVAAKTGATLVCDGCGPLVNELLGRSDLAPARLVEVLAHTPDVRSFRFVPQSGECKPFLAGQHVVLQARVDGKWVQRAYTLSSAAQETRHYEITVKREPRGLLSRWLFDRMRPEDLLRISEPAGHFRLEATHTDDVVCLVGGIGVTPAVSMARTLAGGARAYRLHLDYSVRSAEDAPFAAELRGLATSDPRLSLRLRVTRDEGRLTRAALEDLVERHPSATFFLCAGEDYLREVSEHLRALGVPEARILVEVFAPAGAAAPKPPASAHGHFDHSTLTVPKSPVEEAEQFLQQVYLEIGASGAFAARWAAVQSELARTGTWVQTVDELTHGARVAWRNSTRCVGRLYWQGLTVRDHRHVTTEDEMFQALFEHIDSATNGGNLRATMTVFPSGQGPTSPRVWSTQLFRYAGYRADDGSVLGDPANLELTEVALALGWQPPKPRTAFDILPLIVQIGGRRPQFRDIPRSLVLEVPIIHPDLPFFQELGLKWYALPAVSNVLLDAGGVIYKAAPFNGWYQGTEIGARNFSDPYRYNLLPEVARRMGLDQTSDRTLWRDRALLELNVAVLYSYEKAGVKMMDHHATSHAFDQFEAAEREAGRVVHARWNWIVPPISGSAVTIFHRDTWQDITLKPNYFYQPAPWIEDTSWR
ncbi:MAG: nitric oxide synthase oxygenase [Bradymonadia bacterium]